MPCYDPRDSAPSVQFINKRLHGLNIEQFEAALCAILSATNNPVHGQKNWIFDQVDWKEAGVNRAAVESWWQKHQDEDQIRKSKEAAKAKRQSLKRQALSRLSKEEIEALKKEGLS